MPLAPLFLAALVHVGYTADGGPACREFPGSSCDTDATSLLQNSLTVHAPRSTGSRPQTEASSDSCEHFPQDEELPGENKTQEVIARMEGVFDQLQNELNVSHNIFHRKTLACLQGTFNVERNLSEPFRRGIAMYPSTWPYPTLARLSHDPSRTNGSKLSMAFKLFSVGDSETGTQDFVGEPIDGAGDPMDWASAAAFPDQSDSILGGLNGSLDLDALKPRTADISDLDATVTSDAQYHLDVGGLLPISWGQGRGLRWWASAPHVPRSCSGGSCSVGTALAEYMETNSQQLKVDIYGQLQGCQDEIKNVHVPWKSKAVAKLGELVLTQSLDSNKCEKVAFDPWLSRPDHKPLGSIHRAMQLINSHERKVLKLVPCTHSLANCMTKIYFTDRQKTLA